MIPYAYVKGLEQCWCTLSIIQYQPSFKGDFHICSDSFLYFNSLNVSLIYKSWENQLCYGYYVIIYMYMYCVYIYNLVQCWALLKRKPQTQNRVIYAKAHNTEPRLNTWSHCSFKLLQE